MVSRESVGQLKKVSESTGHSLTGTALNINEVVEVSCAGTAASMWLEFRVHTLDHQHIILNRQYESECAEVRMHPGARSRHLRMHVARVRSSLGGYGSERRQKCGEVGVPGELTDPRSPCPACHLSRQLCRAPGQYQTMSLNPWVGVDILCSGGQSW